MKIFGWSFTGLNTVAQQHLCETHYAEGRTVEAVKMLHIIKTSDGETQVNKATVDWIADFTKKCAVTLEDAGDEAFRSAKYDDAITQYSAALSLSPPSTAGLFIKRSKARVAKESWEDAVQDANEAVKADPSNPWGYKAKHAALHGAKQYDEAIDAFKSMLPVIEQSRDPAIRQLRRNCISPSDTIADIDTLVDKILQSSPLVVIDAQTGCLCDHAEQKRIFKDSPKFKELVSSMTSKLDSERIQQLVASFFGYVTFSHTWQGEEPSFQDVKRAKSVWKLPNTHLNEKLRRFCKETLRHGYNWAWSDTCCIDKDNSSILNQSLTSMFKWYADSAATIVYLADVAHPSMLGDLTRSYWMTRAWTLQELLAPKAIFFYDSGWNRYLDDTSTNHKKSPKIMQELTDAIKIAYGTIDTFSPDNLGVREKLRLASTRNAKFEEDIAYSLIGIFESDIKPHYGEGADAVGHLLEEIVARSGEVTVLAWSGKSSSYNSCLPTSLSVYGQTPHNPPPLEGEELNTCITKLHGKLSEQEVLSICRRINSLPPARFATRRLHLPCIVFPVRGLSKQGLHRGKETLYQAEVSGLGNVGFMSAEDLQLDKQQKFVFVHPWINHLRGPSGGVPWEDELDPDAYTGLDGVVPSQAVPTPDPGRYVQALEMIARLGQPFNALLLAQQPNGRVYKRVAAESEIIVPGLGTNISSKCILAKVLEIL
ncbi:hypothetical protein PISMIDRAFT_159959 [Pisolithus microcarpus 441]|uniref:Heterokaryon incompatibility domain-containing protein n=1 Tax=Pisolithus microcarpus 441 TaxID=765257 RepID=A0A0C9ZGJ5_9AGAM|nr:hypothetical protein PISMIDRAFT_159959 [Pisolithus microcarpus 441]